MSNKIFISYATEDYQYADKLHSFLSKNGFEPWMDKKNLLPGQNWDFQIQQALRKADFIILLLSSISVGKRGYVQKEFNQAVIYCEEKLDSDIYIIPIKIDTCDIPTKLGKFQWVEYSSVDTHNKILQAINFQRSIILKEEELRKHKILGFETFEKNLKGEYGNTNPKQVYEISYKLFKDESNESLRELNALIQGDIIKNLIGIRNNYFNFLKNFDYENELNKSDSMEYELKEFTMLNKSFVSYTSFTSFYHTGAAHGNYGTLGNNYYINPLRSFSLANLFNDFNHPVKILRDIIYNKLLDKAKLEIDIDNPSDFFIYDNPLEPKIENFSNFYFKKNTIVFIYNPYEITSYALGAHHPEITFWELEKLFPDEHKLHSFLKEIKEDQ